MEKKLFLWRAWTADKRIADCGIAWGVDQSEAASIANICLGGPFTSSEVVRFQFEPVNHPSMPLRQVTSKSDRN